MDFEERKKKFLSKRKHRLARLISLERKLNEQNANPTNSLNQNELLNFSSRINQQQKNHQESKEAKNEQKGLKKRISTNFDDVVSKDEQTTTTTTTTTTTITTKRISKINLKTTTLLNELDSFHHTIEKSLLKSTPTTSSFFLTDIKEQEKEMIQKNQRFESKIYTIGYIFLALFYVFILKFSIPFRFPKYLIPIILLINTIFSFFMLRSRSLIRKQFLLTQKAKTKKLSLFIKALFAVFKICHSLTRNLSIFSFVFVVSLKCIPSF
ncbi:hypothetical protein M0813_27433 [Anaeramoeba flamelloides]|uniref:Transmembrane protein n=1 Tax=Anaeramoeba flamelloides TaxID=1746091 RepID=A0ABQ8XXY6_9EUKA|nr:hypothetical protein M0813_27433 [Anaeramoeba flamelloides]